MLHPDRNQAIAAAYASGGYTLKEIGAYFGLHYAHVSRLVRRKSDPKNKTPVRSPQRKLVPEMQDRINASQPHCGQ